MLFVLFLTFNIYHAVPKMLSTDTGGTQMGDISRCLIPHPSLGESGGRVCTRSRFSRAVML